MNAPMTFGEFWDVLAAIGGLLALMLGLFWFVQKQFTAIRRESVDSRAATQKDISELKLHVAETYLTRPAFDRFELRFNDRMDRFEVRLDKHFEDYAGR